MQQLPDDPPPKPAPQDVEQADGKIVRFTPRHRLEPESRPEPRVRDDDDDPGPSAA